MTQLRAERILKTANENFHAIDQSILDLIAATEKAVTDSSRNGLCALYAAARSEYASLRERWMIAVLRKEWLSSRAYTGTVYSRTEMLQLIQSKSFKTLCMYDNFFYGRRQIIHSLDGLAEDFHNLVYGLAFGDGNKEKFDKLVKTYRELLYIPMYVKVNLFGLQ